jgi:hypothetical protein
VKARETAEVILRGPGRLAMPDRPGKVAAQYHTARFRLVPHLAKALSVPVPPLRKPGMDTDRQAGWPASAVLKIRTSTIRTVLIAAIFAGTAAAVYAERSALGEGIRNFANLN